MFSHSRVLADRVRETEKELKEAKGKVCDERLQRALLLLTSSLLSCPDLVALSTLPRSDTLLQNAD